MSVPLLSGGEIILPGISAEPEIYSLKSFLEIPGSILKDRIIIIRSTNNSREAMFSLGAAVSAVMEGKTVWHNPVVDYTAAAVIAFFLWLVLSGMKPAAGTMVFLFVQTAAAAGMFFLMKKMIFVDAAFLLWVNTFVFFTVYYYKISEKNADTAARKKAIRDYVHHKALDNIIRGNKDVRNLNSAGERFLFYMDFDAGNLPDTAAYNKVFEKTREIIYNKTEDFFMRAPGNWGIETVVIDEKADPEMLVEILMEIRERIEDAAYNIFLNKTDVFIYCGEKGIFFEDEKYRLKKESEGIGKKRYILVDENGIQEYVKFARYQKMPGAGGAQFFNITGKREEA
ncbi:MAG TPA: hypothetical protein ENN55_01595 [Firmicutes bacterium]|nr:hypothetical protein [Bacillota bacterium]